MDCVAPTSSRSCPIATIRTCRVSSSPAFPRRDQTRHRSYRYYLTRLGRAAIAAACSVTQFNIVPALALAK